MLPAPLMVESVRFRGVMWRQMLNATVCPPRNLTLSRIGVGVLTFLAPGITTLALLFYIAIRAIATGVLEIVAAIRLRKEIEGELLLILAGLASVAFGVLLVARPGPGALAVLWLIGSYAMVFGVLLLILAFKSRSWFTQS
jgi:uncharacterized membrane protein HdeD (DUF308 family)